MGDNGLSQNESMTTESTHIAQQQFGQLEEQQFRTEWTQDALLVGYRLDGKTRYYHLLKSKIPLGSSLTDRAQREATRAIAFHMLSIEGTLRRPATEAEAEGFANAALVQYKSKRRVAYLGLGLGAYFAYQRASAFGFPFYTPPDPHFFHFFPSPRLPLLQRSAARMIWHIGVRLPLYAAVSVALCHPLGILWGVSRAQAEIRKDSRTAQAINDMFEVKRSQISRRPDGGTSPFPNRAPNPLKVPPGPLPESSLSSEPTYQEMDQNARAFEVLGRDSNVSSLEPKDPVDYDVSKSHFRDMQRRQNLPAKKSYPQGGFSTESTSVDQNQGSTESFYDDTGYSGKLEAEGKSSNTAGGSAWDRIRSENSAPGTESGPRTGKPVGWAGPSRENRQGSPQSQSEQSLWGSRSGGQDLNETKGDSFSFSRSDEERALAKEQAQREFDAMVEAERKGGDVQTTSKEGGSRREVSRK